MEISKTAVFQQPARIDAPFLDNCWHIGRYSWRVRFGICDSHQIQPSPSNACITTACVPATIRSNSLAVITEPGTGVSIGGVSTPSAPKKPDATIVLLIAFSTFSLVENGGSGQ